RRLRRGRAVPRILAPAPRADRGRLYRPGTAPFRPRGPGGRRRPARVVHEVDSFREADSGVRRVRAPGPHHRSLTGCLPYIGCSSPGAPDPPARDEWGGVSRGPPPPPSRGPPPTGLQRPPPQTQTERNLAKPLEDVYKNLALCAGPLMLGQSPSDLEMLLTPIESIDPVLGALMKNGVPAANLAPVEEKMIKRLTTVIAQTAFGNGSSRNEIFNNVVVNGTRRNGKLTIGQFMGLTPQRQLEVIDLGWTRVCLQKVYNKASSAMYEPTDVV